MRTLSIQKKRSRPAAYGLCLAVCAWLCGLACALPGREAAGASAAFDRLFDTKATTHHWQLARDYERQMRHELARQHYLLALASCRSESAQAQLRRELESIDLQIRTMR